MVKYKNRKILKGPVPYKIKPFSCDICDKVVDFKTVKECLTCSHYFCSGCCCKNCEVNEECENLCCIECFKECFCCGKKHCMGCSTDCTYCRKSFCINCGHICEKCYEEFCNVCCKDGLCENKNCTRCRYTCEKCKKDICFRCCEETNDGILCTTCQEKKLK